MGYQRAMSHMAEKTTFLLNNLTYIPHAYNNETTQNCS